MRTVEVQYRTLIPVADVLNSANEHATAKYDIPVADVRIDETEYTIYLGKETARHKKCYLSLERKNSNEYLVKVQSSFADNHDLVSLYGELLNQARIRTRNMN